MLQQLKMLGDYMEERGEGGLKSQLSDLSGREKYLCLDFSEQNGQYSFDKVSVVDIGAKGHGRENALYKKKKGNAPDLTPTARVTRLYSSDEYTRAQSDDSMKSNDTLSWNTKRWYDKEDSNSPYVEDVREELSEKEDEIRDELKQRYEEATTGDLDANDLVLTVRYEDSGKYQMIGDIQFFRDKIRKSIISEWRSKHGVESFSEGVCTVCGKKKEVYGFASPYKFYTLDNMRYAPDFDQSQSWKSLPICEECGLNIKTGKKFLMNQINGRGFRYNVGETLAYFVIPEFLSQVDYEFLDWVSDDSQENTEDALLDAEDYYQYEGEGALNLTFMFVKDLNDDTATSLIKKKIEDVAPSHLNQLDESLSNLYSDFYGSVGSYGEQLEFDEPEDTIQLDNIIRRVIPAPDRDDAEEAFFNQAMGMTAKILKEKTLEENSLIKMFSKDAKSRFRTSRDKIPNYVSKPKRKNYYSRYTIRTFFFLEFLRENDLLDSEVKDTMKSYEQIVEDLDTEENENLKEFFEEHSEAFDAPEKKAVFLEGVLAQNLMDKQRMMRDTEEPPFRKKLANLRLDSAKVKQLFPEISQTLDIYNSKAEPQYRNSYSDLRETIGHYMLLSDQNDWSISDDEISYFFTLGMSLNQVFKNNNNGEQ